MKKTLTYADAGVNIDAGNQLVENIKKIVPKTHRPEVLGGLGGFGGLFQLSDKYQSPVLVAGTDGVGTKLKLAIELNRHDTIGIDLLAMCVNDLVVCGAEPLFFLDYYATDKLNVEVASDVITGIAEGCQQAGCALLGGETAEMPGMYHSNEYDLAGFSLGVVERDDIIDGSKIEPDNAIIGIASSGPHSNGYSLIRKILVTGEHQLSDPFEDSTLGEVLLTPTVIYTRAVTELTRSLDIHGIAHITGGGLIENLPRILPKTVQALINCQRWSMPSIFHWLKQEGQLSNHELYRTFNAGIGLVVILPKDLADAAISLLSSLNLTAWQIGHIQERGSDKEQIVMENMDG